MDDQVKNRMYNEIGLELELFLLDENDVILEPMTYGFPSDEMGFLVEIRSEHSNNPHDVIRSLSILETINELKASDMGFKLICTDSKKVTSQFIDYITRKYHHAQFPNYTMNIYNHHESHHTGFKDGRATAGLHVHFSRRKINGIESTLVKLPTLEIVSKMDKKFRIYIAEVNRIPGEYENKIHGFEYRSLPATSPIEEVVVNALKILEETE